MLLRLFRPSMKIFEGTVNARLRKVATVAANKRGSAAPNLHQNIVLEMAFSGLDEALTEYVVIADACLKTYDHTINSNVNSRYCVAKRGALTSCDGVL